MSENNHNLEQLEPTSSNHQQPEPDQPQSTDSQQQHITPTDTLMYSFKRHPDQVYERIVLEGVEDDSGVSPDPSSSNPNHQENDTQAQSDSNRFQETGNQLMEEGQMHIQNGIYDTQVKVDDERHSQDGPQFLSTSKDPEPRFSLTPIFTEPPSISTQHVTDEDKANETIERYESDIQQNEEPQSHEQTPLPTTNSPTPQTTQPLPNQYNSYLQAVLNTPLDMSAEPTQAVLEFIHQALKVQMSPYKPEQIYILLYNNLIKGPRQTLIENEAKECDPTIKYDGGIKYWNQINNPSNNNPNNPNHNSNKYELVSFDLRKQMIGVYVTKGYGLKVFQDHLKTINPNAPEIDKDKFKKHFIEIYKITMRKVEQFLTKTADRQFEPLRKQQYQKPLSDVINCKKHYSPQFCEVFYRILQATFDINFQNVPTEEQVIFFYKTIMEKLRATELKMVKKLHQPEEQKDTDVWTKEFQEMFIRTYITQGDLANSKAKLIEMYPECQAFITNEKLTEKLQNAIRTAIRYLVVSNTDCGNEVLFQPSDTDKKFIMRATELKNSRIKLLKVYVKRPSDPQVLQNIVSFILEQLRIKYEIEGIPAEVIRKAQARQLPREVERSGLESLLKSQLVRNY